MAIYDAILDRVRYPWVQCPSATWMTYAIIAFIGFVVEVFGFPAILFAKLIGSKREEHSVYLTKKKNNRNERD